MALSIEDLAVATGLAPGAVAALERGRYNITIAQLRTLARVLRLTLPQLLKRAESRVSSRSP